MELFVTGLDFVQNALLFEKLQNLDKGTLSAYTQRLREGFEHPIVFLLTCDRFEIYSFSSPYPAEKAERILSLNPLMVKKYRYSISSDEALCHLFGLSSGILSPLFGEDTIISQLVSAIEGARTVGASSSRLDKLFNMAIAFGKKCQSTLSLRSYETVIGNRLLELTKGLGEILVVGSGDWARNIAKTLLSEHVVYMTLRDPEKIFLLPEGVKSIAYEDRRKKAIECEAVISSSSGLYHTFTESDGDILKGKLLVDLASPEDIPNALKPLRLEDLDIVLEGRNRNISIIAAESDALALEYKRWLRASEESQSVSDDAIDLASDVVRRLSSPIKALALEDEVERELKSAIYETVRRSYIGSVLSRK